MEATGDAFLSASEEEVAVEYSHLARKRGLKLQFDQHLENPLALLGAILPPGALHRLQEWNRWREDLTFSLSNDRSIVVILLLLVS